MTNDQQLTTITIMPFFSIVIPAYNVAPYICGCLDSVLVQTFHDWEAICVDDGSTDCSGMILDEYARRDCRVRVIHQKKLGEGGARNSGLLLAKGEWVFFLDADDVMLPNSLSWLSACISPVDTIIRFGYSAFVTGCSPESSGNGMGIGIIDISSEIKMSEFYTYMWQHIYRRSVIGELRFKSYTRGCDRVFLNAFLLNRTNSVKVIDAICYGYRKRLGSAMNTIPSAQVLRDEMDHRLDIIEMIDAGHKKVDYAGNDWLEKYFTRCIYQIIKTRGSDRREVLSDWWNRLRRLRRVKGLSLCGRFVAWTCSVIRLWAWDTTVCYVIPRLLERGSVFRYLKRKLGFVSNEMPQVL